jgi:hypothetical protein
MLSKTIFEFNENVWKILIVSSQLRATLRNAVYLIFDLPEAESFSLLDAIYHILDATVDGEVKCEV